MRYGRWSPIISPWSETKHRHVLSRRPNSCNTSRREIDPVSDRWGRHRLVQILLEGPGGRIVRRMGPVEGEEQEERLAWIAAEEEIDCLSNNEVCRMQMLRLVPGARDDGVAVQPMVEIVCIAGVPLAEPGDVVINQGVVALAAACEVQIAVVEDHVLEADLRPLGVDVQLSAVLAAASTLTAAAPLAAPPFPRARRGTYPGLNRKREGRWRGPFFFIQVTDPQFGMYDSDQGNRPTPAALAAYRREFGDDRFTFWAGGVCGLALNSNLYWDPTGAPGEQARQEAWLARALQVAREAGAKQILVFQHHPWFLTKPDEPDDYFTIPRARRDPALALMRAAGVRAVFAGHYHRNAHGWDGDLEMITTSAVGKPLGNDPSGFRIVQVYEDRIEHAYYGLDEVPPIVRLT